jgi:adenosylhomocysteine nucleosidase
LVGVHEQKTFGIVFALGAEMRGLRRVLSHSRQVRANGVNQAAWQVGGVRVVAEVSGMGRSLCSAATHRLIDQGASWIACAGFAAALDTKAKVSDVVIADSVKLAGSDFPTIECSTALMASTPPSGRLGFSIWRSDMVTSDRIILRASEKSSIYRDTGAAALDMEAYAAAEACLVRRVPFVVVKGISDTAEQDLPEEVGALATAQRWTDQLGLIAPRPTLWPQLWRLRKNTLLAADNLGDVLGTMLLRLFG